MKKTKNSSVAIRLLRVTKKYTIHHEKPTLVEKFIHRGGESFFALKNINLEVAEGERVGFMGPNGCGKTTLLKIITGITAPTSGKVEAKGKIVSLIDLEAGFHPELSGIQNIHLNGMLLGLGSKEVKNRLGEIVQFANIGKFIDVPLFTYSEGMKARLGFAVAVNTDPDILVLDENIAVGDENFRKACYAKINTFFKEGKTIIMASHDSDFIRKNCDRVIEIKKGRVFRQGPPAKIISLYKKE